MSTGIYVEGDNVDVYVDGSFRGQGKVVEASTSMVRVRFRDKGGETKTFDSQIANTLSKNSENGNWEIDVVSSAFSDLP